MQIVSNSRQIPKTKEYIANSSYCDNLYGYLQAMSHWDGVLTHPRFVYKKEINYSKIAKDLNRSRQTISTKFKLMLEGTKENEIYKYVVNDNNKKIGFYYSREVLCIIKEEDRETEIWRLFTNTKNILFYAVQRSKCIKLLFTAIYSLEFRP